MTPIAIAEVEDVDLAFPARGPELTPGWDDIDEDLKTVRNAPVEVFFVSQLFYDLVERPSIQLGPRDPNWGQEEIDKAWRHLSVVLGTYGTKHEHKVAGAAMLIRSWFHAIRWTTTRGNVYGTADVTWPDDVTTRGTDPITP